MRKGFIFNHNLCVGCNSCSASCLLENNFDFVPREILKSDTASVLPYSVINLSLACNHCEVPVCLNGCPAGAFRRDLASGAVILDNSKCIGCRYCLWVCPYGAPKFDSGKGITDKCHLCHHRISEGIAPACTTACPVNALSYGNIPDNASLTGFAWFPDKKINPALSLTGSSDLRKVKQVPVASIIITENPKVSVNKITEEWSLIFFSFLASVAAAIAALGKDFLFGGSLALALCLTVLAAVLSLSHLGKPLRAWRSLSNLRHSPVSLEILLLGVFGATLLANQLFNDSISGIILPVISVLLVFSVDSVYFNAESFRKDTVRSGQSVFIAATIFSWLSGSEIAFIFMAASRILLGFHSLYIQHKAGEIRFFSLRYFRIAILIILVLALITGLNQDSGVLLILLFTGEFIDRALFYVDFKPVNISETITAAVKSNFNEKK
jgi:Fe-S-cluster-containing dehydrogenase component/DMSO reductase anchor subunit